MTRRFSQVLIRASHSPTSREPREDSHKIKTWAAKQPLRRSDTGRVKSSRSLVLERLAERSASS